jgi:hypothetical protein
LDSLLSFAAQYKSATNSPAPGSDAARAPMLPRSKPRLITTWARVGYRRGQNRKPQNERFAELITRARARVQSLPLRKFA